MSRSNSNESMLDMYLFETDQNVEQLEASVISCEKNKSYTSEDINEIFRIMHTIKGSSAMMLFQNISSLAHSVEDIFFLLREDNSDSFRCEDLTDIVLESVDFIKNEIQRIKSGNQDGSDPEELIRKNRNYLEILRKTHATAQADSGRDSTPEQKYYIIPEKNITNPNMNYFKANIKFEDGCEMENIRAYTIIHSLKEVSQELYYIPSDIIDNDNTIQIIRDQGFTIFAKTDLSCRDIESLLEETIFLKSLELIKLDDNSEFLQFEENRKALVIEKPIKPVILHEKEQLTHDETHQKSQSIISVSVSKLDKLMDQVGEMVIAEAMVTQNPEFLKLGLESFKKSTRLLHKITNEIQNMVMSIRMVPLSVTFLKMERVVRDMGRKLGKEVSLQIIGEETEVDKNIIEHISDPLMHLVRNAVDHGIELPQERELQGKTEPGVVILEAKNAGSDVLILVKDNGKGLNKERILEKAGNKGLLKKNRDEMSDKEIFSLIFQPGFSTKDEVSEYSGRGVGMDVVTKNLEGIGGSVFVDSVEGTGTTISMRIPLTLAIIDGMIIRVGQSRFTIPTNAIRESFRPKPKDVFKDPDSNEMIMVRGKCHPIIRLHQLYDISSRTDSFDEGILIMVELDSKAVCLFADELIGQQQVVVKPIPNYIKNNHRINGLAGCTLLGDGGISLILDIGSFL